MKSITTRLPKAPLNACIVHTFGIAGNSSPAKNTQTGYTFFKNQNNNRLWRLPKLLAAVVLMLLTFSVNAQTYSFALSGANMAVPNASPGTGTATVTINSAAQTMRVVCNFSSLLGNVTAAHLHAATSSPNTGTSGVATTTPTFFGFPNGVTTGNCDQTYDMTLTSSYNPLFITANGGTASSAFTALQNALAQNKAYFDIHTATFGGGELRAFPASAGPSLSLSADSTNVPELTPAKTVVYTVTASAAVGTNQKVKITFTGTASAADYIISGLVGDSLTIPANATSASFSLTPVDDAIVENAETVIATMSGPTSGFTLGSPVSHTLTIRANDTPAGFTLTSAGGGCTGNFPSSVNFTYDSVFNGHPSYSGISGFYTVTISFINGKWVFTTINVSSFTLSNQDTPLPPCSGTVSEGMNTNTNTSFNCTGTTFSLSTGCTMPIFTVATTKQDATCSSANDGWAKATPSGTCGTGYQYLWTPGNFTTDSIGGLAPGTYNVRIVCGTDTVNKSVVVGAGAGPAAPTTTGSLVVYTGSKTLNQLEVTPLTGGTVNYYYSATGGTALAGSTVVVDDTTYYITQTVAGCESTPRKQIKVNRIANDSIVLCNPATVAGLTATPVTGSNASWYNVATGGAALTNTASLPAGQNTMYVEETSGGAPGTIAAYTATAIGAGIYSLALGEQDSIYYGTFYDSARIIRISGTGTDSTVLLTSNQFSQQTDHIEFVKNATGRYLYYSQGNQIKALNFATNTSSVIYTGAPGELFMQFSLDTANNKIYFTKFFGFKVHVLNVATGTVNTVDSLTTEPIYGVSYAAPNTIYFGINSGKVYRKNLITGVRTDSLTIGSGSNPIRTIYALANGKVLISTANQVKLVNADLTGGSVLATTSFGIRDARMSSTGSFIYNNGNTIMGSISKTSNRVPVTVIVNPAQTVVATADQVVCNSNSVTAVNFSTTTTGGTVTYTWTNNKPGIGLAATGSGNIASFTGVNNGTAPDTATIIVTPTITNSGVSCVGVKDTFLMVVNPTAQVNTIANKVACNSATVAAINFSTTRNGGTTTYAWTNTATSIGLAASGTGNISSFTATNTGTAPVTATIKVTPTFTSGGVSCNGPDSTFTITVNPTATVNAISDMALCNNTATTAVSFSSPASGGTIVYNWTNNNTSIGLAASGSGTIPAFTAVNNGNAPVTATIIVTPTFTNAGVSCTGLADTFYIDVNPTAKINAISNQVACNNTTVSSVTPTSPTTGGTVTCAWTNNNTSIGLAAGGSGIVPSFTATNSGTAPVTATITVTPTFTNAGVSCTGTPITYTVTVNPTATVNAVTNQVLCNNSASTAVNFGTTATGGTVTYAWTNSNASIGLAASGSGNIASFTATNSGTAPVTATITVTPAFTNAGVSCQGTAQTFTITVNPTAVVNTIANKVVCNNTPVAAINFGTTATGGTVTYNWTNNNTSFGLAASGTGNIAAFTAVNNTNAPQTATITVTPAFSNGGVSCTGTATTFTITVNPEMIVNAISSQVLCNNAATGAVNFSTPTTGGTIVYNWTNSNTAIGLAASGTGNIASFTAANNTSAPISGTITVIAAYTNAGINCTSAPQTFVYTVNPTATVNAVSNQAVCNNNAAAAVNFSSPATGGTVTYAWTNNNSSIGLAASGTGNIASFTATNSSNAPVTATITVTPTYTNGGVSCTGTNQSFTITVNPTAMVNAVSNQVVCAGVSNSAVTFSSPVAGTTYTWTNSNPSIGLAASGTGNIPSFVAVNPSPNAVNATITVTPNTPAGCIGQPITYTVTVNGLSAAPASISNPTPIVCANNAFATLSVNGGALGSGAVWKWYADSLNTVSIGSGATLANIPVAKTTTYFVRAEGTCNNTAAASVVVQRANLVYHVRQHWSDVLLFDNSSNNYVAWQWYKNGAAVAGANLQQYSESNALAGTYYVVATDKNGGQSISCPLTITAGSFTGLRISLFPNPADKGANVTISTSFTASELQGAAITITDVFGRVIRQIAQVTPSTAIQAPTSSGMYIVTLTLQNGMKYSANLLTK